MKVSELIGAELDKWIAKAEGKEPVMYGDKCYIPIGDGCGAPYSPSTDWSQGGPIIERKEITFDWVNTPWGKVVVPCRVWPLHHRSPLVSAMRYFVFCKFGDVVDDSQAHNVES